MLFPLQPTTKTPRGHRYPSAVYAATQARQPEGKAKKVNNPSLGVRGRGTFREEQVFLRFGGPSTLSTPQTATPTWVKNPIHADITPENWPSTEHPRPAGDQAPPMPAVPAADGPGTWAGTHVISDL